MMGSQTLNSSVTKVKYPVPHEQIPIVHRLGVHQHIFYLTEGVLEIVEHPVIQVSAMQGDSVMCAMSLKVAFDSSTRYPTLYNLHGGPSIQTPAAHNAPLNDTNMCCSQA